MAEEPAFKRRQFIVDRDYQLQFVLKLLSVLAVIAATTLACSFAIMWANMYDPELPRQGHLLDSLLAATLTLCVEIVIAMPFMWFFGIRQTHKVVGPLQRIKDALDAIGKGDFKRRIVLRKGDVLWELADEINLMAERLERRHSDKD